MHYHSAFWRVDFNIGGKGGEQVEQFDTKLDGQGGATAKLKTTRTAIAKEGTFNSRNQRWWRVVSPKSKNEDGHKRARTSSPPVPTTATRGTRRPSRT
nr:hypothetical protein GCM10020092_090490 [Actinoplanes digitatis]